MSLELDHVSISVHGRTLVRALSATIAPGRVLALMGANGSGKSSLLAWIAGTLEPPLEARGTLRLNGRDLAGVPIQQRRIVLLFQDDLLFPHMNVRDNLLFAVPAGPRAARVQAAENALDEAGLAGFGERMPGSLSVGETLADARRVLELAGRRPDIAPAAGLYPTHLDPADLEAMLAFVREHRAGLIAVGEIGLDHWVVKEEAAQEIQREFFLRQVRLAMELDLPVNVHSRGAGRHAVGALVEAGARRVLMHAFDGRAGAALEGVRHGFFFSIPPSVVRSRQKQKLVRALRLSVLLLETDSPVLGPEPGVRNVLRWLGMLPGDPEPIQGIPVLRPRWPVRRILYPYAPRTGIAHMDRQNLAEADRLAEVLAAHPEVSTVL